MIKFIRNLFKSRKLQHDKKINVKMMLWDREDVERLQKIGKKIHNENNNK